MRSLKIFLLLCILSFPIQAQIVKTFAWDASDSAATAPPANPVKYRLYNCTDQTYSSCAIVDAGTALQVDMSLHDGTQYLYCTAYWFSLVVDGVPQGTDTIESGKSNILKAEVKVPPGNPKNAKVKITTIASSMSGQTLRK